MKYLYLLAVCILCTMSLKGQEGVVQADDRPLSDTLSTDPRTIWRIGFNLDFIFADFDDFAPVIGSYNTDVMNDFILTGPEVGVSISDFYAGCFIELGYLYDYCTFRDSLVVYQLSSAYGINIGYDLINSGRIRLTPLMSFRVLRLRLKNYDSADKIPLTQYIDDRDLDLRFNQSAFTGGINLDYKFYIKQNGEPTNNCWTFGLYGGYIGKLDKSIWLYSQGNRLTTDKTMEINHFTFMCSVSFLFN